MVFADKPCDITGLTQQIGQARFWADPWMVIGIAMMSRRPLTAMQAPAICQAYGRRCAGVAERDTLRKQPVKVACLYITIAERADGIIALLIGVNEQDIRLQYSALVTEPILQNIVFLAPFV